MADQVEAVGASCFYMLDVKQIVLPVDFSPRSEAAARYAQVVASRFHSHIVLLHVEHDPFIGGEEIGAPPMGSIEHKFWLRARLESFLRSELREPAVTRVLLEGDPAAQIVELARADRDCLIVMPAHGHGAVRQFLLPSVVAKVLHDSECPVWTGFHLAEAAPTPSLFFRKIVCAIDLGPHTRSALLWASQFASAFGALLLVVHVVKPPGGLMSTRDPQLQAVNRAKTEIANLLNSLGIEAEIAVASGSVPQALHDVILGFAADILVVGRCAVSGRLHSDTHAMIRHSPCPVVSV